MTHMSPIEKLAAFYPEVGDLLAERDNLADDVRRRTTDQARTYRELHARNVEVGELRAELDEVHGIVDRMPEDQEGVVDLIVERDQLRARVAELEDRDRIFSILSPYYGALTNSAIEDITAKLRGEA